MANYPMLCRYKGSDGKWSARVHADTPDQAKGFLTQWREQGFTEFNIEDSTGQPMSEKDL